jgi:hypothetical protein
VCPFPTLTLSCLQNLHKEGGHHTVSGGAYGFGFHPLFQSGRAGESYGRYAEKVGCSWTKAEKADFEHRAMDFAAEVEAELEEVFSPDLFARTTSTVDTLKARIAGAGSLPALETELKRYVAVVINKVSA